MLTHSSPFSSPFARGGSTANPYRQISVETGITDASPHKLVAMLFDGFLDAVAQARGAMQRRDFEAKGLAIGRAIMILENGLHSGLNMDTEGPLARSLGDLYRYLVFRLTKANRHNDDAGFGECAALIEPLRNAWMAISAHAAFLPPAGKAAMQ